MSKRLAAISVKAARRYIDVKALRRYMNVKAARRYVQAGDPLCMLKRAIRYACQSGSPL